MSLRVNEIVGLSKAQPMFRAEEVQAPVVSKPVESVKKDSKLLPVVTSAIALASMGVAIAALKKKPAGSDSKEIIDALKKEIGSLKAQLADKSVNEELMSKYNH